jgi:D-alanyl-D-alanine carboxypeptidase
MKKKSVIPTFIRHHLLGVMVVITLALSVAVIVVVVGTYISARKTDPDLLNDPAAQTPAPAFDPSATGPTTGLTSTTGNLPSEGFTATSESALTPTSEPTLSETKPAETTHPSASETIQETTVAPTPTGPVWYDGFVDPRTVEYEIVSNPGDITVLINKYYAVSEDYVPELVPAASSSNQQLRPEANAAWDLMRAACLEDTGKTLYLTAGYSTFQQRIDLFEGAIKKVNDGVAGFTMKRVVSKYAYAGRSEHNVGLALDIREINDSDISSNFLNTTAGAWMSDHAHEYGFILRYPADKGHITGYDFEAWHFRYVGVDLATTLYDGNLTLEEYYGKEQALP